MRYTYRSGLAGLEFALIAPVLLTLFLGTIDISGALLTARRMALAAGAVAEIGTTSAAQTAALNVLTTLQAWQATTAPFALFPTWADKVNRATFAVTLSSITFMATPSGCTGACAYVARVRWSVANNLGVQKLRVCGALPSAPNGDPASYLSLPIGNYGITSLLVADISYTFVPTFFGFLFGPIPMMQSAFVSPRINTGIDLVQDGGAGASVICPLTS